MIKKAKLIKLYSRAVSYDCKKVYGFDTCPASLNTLMQAAKSCSSCGRKNFGQLSAFRQ
jgi:hypothetical protein